jgi:hypothetical protein
MTVLAPARSFASGRGARALRRALLTLALTLLTAEAWAHATIVFGTVTSEPTPPTPDRVTTLRLEMVDPVDAPVEDALVFVEATPPSGGEPIVSDRFAEPEAGLYQIDLALTEPGAWTLLFRDQTFRQEEARATLQVVVGEGGTREPLSFIFPPTATGPQGIGTWLLWLIGLPVAAGAIVTIMVLRGGQPDPAAEERPSDA